MQKIFWVILLGLTCGSLAWAGGGKTCAEIYRKKSGLWLIKWPAIEIGASIPLVGWAIGGLLIDDAREEGKLPSFDPSGHRMEVSQLFEAATYAKLYYPLAAQMPEATVLASGSKDLTERYQRLSEFHQKHVVQHHLQMSFETMIDRLHDINVHPEKGCEGLFSRTAVAEKFFRNGTSNLTDELTHSVQKETEERASAESGQEDLVGLEES